jgi:RNA polymerase subunit RPABC4/transcription elongation factor Spt4
MTHVLTTIGDKYYVISEQQRDAIQRFLEAGAPRAFRVGESVIMLNQVSGIEPMAVYRRQMKHKLAQKNLKLCRRCHEIVPLNAECPCKDKPEKYPDILTVAREENPRLAEHLDELTRRKALPPSQAVL